MIRSDRIRAARRFVSASQIHDLAVDGPGHRSVSSKGEQMRYLTTVVLGILALSSIQCNDGSGGVTGRGGTTGAGGTTANAGTTGSAGTSATGEAGTDGVGGTDRRGRDWRFSRDDRHGRDDARRYGGNDRRGRDHARRYRGNDRQGWHDRRGRHRCGGNDRQGWHDGRSRHRDGRDDRRRRDDRRQDRAVQDPRAQYGARVSTPFHLDRFHYAAGPGPSECPRTRQDHWFGGGFHLDRRPDRLQSKWSQLLLRSHG